MNKRQKYWLIVFLAVVFLPGIISCTNWNDKLWYSTIHGMTADVNKSLSKGGDVNARSEHGITLLMFAASQGYKDISRLLIDKGADVNAKDDKGYTILMYAVNNNNKDISELLIVKGADVNAKDNDGNTALGIAIKNKNPDIERLLKNAGAK